MIENIRVIAPAVFRKREFSKSLYNMSRPHFFSDHNAFPTDYLLYVFAFRNDISLSGHFKTWIDKWMNADII